MAINTGNNNAPFDFAKAFGLKNQPQQRGNNRQQDDRPKANLWLNIGYSVQLGKDEDGNDIERFVNLPLGLALDIMEELPTNQSNDEFRAMQMARNELLKQLLQFSEDIPAGEARKINLEIEVRRVKDAPAPIENSENPLIRQIKF